MDFSAHEGEVPIPVSSSTYNIGHSHVHTIIHQNTPPPPPPPPPPPRLSTEDNNKSNKKGSLMVKYKECLKNHAASIGGNATDGCGEFMPNGEEGTLEALKCSACNCHRNFHRKEIEGEELNNFSSFRKLSIGGGYNNNNNNIFISRPTAHNMIVPLQTSELDEGHPRPPFAKKRFRTKFTSEQKVKMLSFAERAGWKLQKQEESVVQQLCQEIGVKRRVLKVWIHNNKHTFAKKASLPSSYLNESNHTGIADSRGGF